MQGGKFLVLANSAAGQLASTGKRKAFEALVNQELGERLHSLAWFEGGTSQGRQQWLYALDQLRHDPTLIPVAAGGDGTINQLLNHLVQGVEQASPPKPVMGVLPVGSGNDSCRSLDIPLYLRAALQVLATAQPRAVDLLKTQIDNQDQVTYGLTMGAIALPARVVKATQNMGALGSLKYAAATLLAIFNQGPDRLTARIDDQPHVADHSAWLLGIANGSNSGGGMQMVPGAQIDDGYCDLVQVDAASRLRLISLLLKVFSGSHTGDAKFTTRQVRSLEVMPQTPTQLTLDGELHDVTTSVRFSCHPSAIQVLRP